MNSIAFNELALEVILLFFFQALDEILQSLAQAQEKGTYDSPLDYDMTNLQKII